MTLSILAKVDRTFDAFGDPTRRQVFERLRGGTRSVSKLLGEA